MPGELGTDMTAEEVLEMEKAVVVVLEVVGTDPHQRTAVVHPDEDMPPEVFMKASPP